MQASVKDASSLITAPKFLDPQRYDFRLEEDSPVKQIGFEPFDFRRAGLYGDEMRKAKGADLQVPFCPGMT